MIFLSQGVFYHSQAFTIAHIVIGLSLHIHSFIHLSIHKDSLHVDYLGASFGMLEDLLSDTWLILSNKMSSNR